MRRRSHGPCGIAHRWTKPSFHLQGVARASGLNYVIVRRSVSTIYRLNAKQFVSAVFQEEEYDPFGPLVRHHAVPTKLKPHRHSETDRA